MDASLGNIRENIRKGANQKHISTSMVDPLKQMKKSGTFLVTTILKIFMVFFRSKCSCFKENASIEIFGRAGKSKRDKIRSIVVKCKSIKQIDGNEIWMVIILYIHCASIFLLSPTNIPFRASKNN